MKDLVVVVSDLHIEEVIKSLIIKRFPQLNIRELEEKDFDIFRESNDSDCRRKVEKGLHSYLNKYSHVLVLFDYHGCGLENKLTRIEIEQRLEKTLVKNGWEAEQVAVVVIDPEVEMWAWGDWDKLEAVLGWDKDKEKTNLKSWLVSKKLLKPDQQKPNDPEEALSDSLKKIRKIPIKKGKKEKRIKLESAEFRALAEKINFQKCTDSAFGKFKEVMYNWFREE